MMDSIAYKYGKTYEIIATIGPASDSESELRKIIDASMDVARLGLAHGTLDEALSDISEYAKLRFVKQVEFLVTYRVKDSVCSF